MKFQQSEHFTEKSSTVAGQNFNVSLSAKMFETLFSNMYRYKEAAATRELERNAYDAHVMRDRFYRVMPSHYQSVYAIQKERVSKYLAPLGTKHEVHLPDMYEPYLEVKDFGIGLHIDDIIGKPIEAELDEVLIEGNIIVKDDSVPEGSAVIGEPAYYGNTLVFRNPENNEILRSPGLYTTIFNSTKADDNNQVGAYGLGSKSPFAISDSFTVESRYEGELHRFLMYLNESRIPCVDIVTKDLETRDPKPESTDLWNGLTVNVPVRQSQYNKFAEELARLCRVMDEKDIPIIKNRGYAGNFSPIDRSHKVYNTYIQSNTHHGSSHYAVMGGVAYPIDLNQLSAENNGMLSKFPSTYTYFALGAMNIPPSREDLTYDEFGRKALNIEFDKLRKGLMKEAEIEMEEAYRKGPILAFMARGKFIDLYGASFASMMDKKYPRDERISSSGNLRMPKLYLEKDPNLKMNRVSYTDLIKTTHFFKLSKFGVVNRQEIDNLDLKSDNFSRYIYVILDDSKTYIQKIKKLAETTERTVILVIPNANLISYRNAKLRLQYKNAKEIRSEIREWVGCKEHIDHLQFADKFSDYYDGLINNDIRFMSELPYERPVVSKNSSIGLVSVENINNNNNFSGTSVKLDFVQNIIDSGKKIIYVEMKGHEVIHEIDINGERGVIDTSLIWDFKSGIYQDNRSPYVSETLGEINGYAKGVYMARKMSMPFLRQHPEIFVPIDVAIKEFYDIYSDVFKGLEFQRFSGMAKTLKFQKNNMFYPIWAVKQLGAGVDVNDEVSVLLKKMMKFQEDAVGASKLTSEYEKQSKALLAPFEGILKTHLRFFNTLSGMMMKLFKLKDMTEEEENVLQLQYTHEHLLDDVAELIGVDTEHFKSNRNKEKKSRYRSYTSRLESRETVRKSIEMYLLREFINTNYKAKMGNKLNGPDQHRRYVISRVFKV